MTRPRRPNPPRSTPPAAQAGAVRIIGGRWRGTRLPVADMAGLRPTGDRMRETLFNWLQTLVPGARVLDLFAGSGALGLESLSRGAAEAVLVEKSGALVAGLRELAGRLPGGEAACIVQADALAWLDMAVNEGRSFDIAFVDPPFDGGLWDGALQRLLPLMAENAAIYIEAPAAMPAQHLPPEWRLHRESGTRDVACRLYRRG